MIADILIKNGRVIDPSRGVDSVGDIAVAGRRIVAAVPGMQARTVIDAAGGLVTPGLIDFHAHIFERGTDSGINPDIAMLPNGVTTVVDAGSSGVSSYRSFLDRLNLCRVKTKLFLQVSPTGQITHQYPEILLPERWNLSKVEEAVELCGKRLLGFKLRIGEGVVGDRGVYLLEKSKELADRFGLHLVVHVTDSPVLQSKVASMLGAGDVFCHVYHGRGNTIFEDGRIPEAIWEARKRGVIFDCCHGSANFCYPIAERAIAEGFLPDVISSDMNTISWCKPPLFSLEMVMSKLLMLGMELGDVIERVTSAPAKLIGEDGKLGTLAPGTCADIAILKLVEQPIPFMDTEGETRLGQRYFSARTTILDGQLVYRAQELSF